MVKLDGSRTTTIHANGNKCRDESVTYVNQRNERELAMRGKCRRSECGPLEHQILGDRETCSNWAGKQATPKTVSSVNHEVHDARGLGIRAALGPETIVNSLAPLNTDQSTHMLRARLNKMSKMCFWRKPLKDCCQMPSNYPIRPLDMLLIIFCASSCT